MGAYGISYNGDEVLIKDRVLDHWIREVFYLEAEPEDDHARDQILEGALYIAEKLTELIGLEIP